MNKIKNYIHGSHSSSSEKTLPIFDPSTGEQISEVVNSNIDDFKKLIESSEKGFNIWREFTPLKRSRIISKYKELIEKDISELFNSFDQDNA